MDKDDVCALVRFISDYDDKHPDMIVAYLAGMTIELPEDVAQRALEAGAIELLDENDHVIDLDALDDEDEHE